MLERRKHSSSQQATPTLRRKKKSRWSLFLVDVPHFAICILFVLFAAAASGLILEFFRSSSTTTSSSSSWNGALTTTTSSSSRALLPEKPPPILPIFAPVPNAEEKIRETLQNKPSLAGIVAILQNFVAELHAMNYRYASVTNQNNNNDDPSLVIVRDLFELTEKHLGRFDHVYQGRSIFPVRDDDSIFLSLAAFREHLLADTLAQAFSKAKRPQALFVGVVVQNCFGKVIHTNDDNNTTFTTTMTFDTSGLPCKTGAQVIGKDPRTGRDMTKVSDAPPDKNGIQDFCARKDFQSYCDSGQIRVLYVHETESLGPAMARYYASKLWVGETFFMQTDSHLLFADDWDEKYRLEINATRSFPKSILSSYPPGFQNGVSFRGSDKTDPVVKESNGERLCVCSTELQDPNPIVRINTGAGYKGDEIRPTQIPFIAAGFFFTTAQFLVDVPFDPYMPYLFMGEEIALSMRAWTHGWNIYAPRKNLIAHEYRPGRMGLPKFWGTVNRLFGPTGTFNTDLQSHVIKRVKNMVGYPDSTLDKISALNLNFVMKDIEHYGLGSVRSWEEYMEFAHMSIDQEHDIIICSKISWCNQGLKD